MVNSVEEVTMTSRAAAVADCRLDVEAVAAIRATDPITANGRKL